MNIPGYVYCSCRVKSTGEQFEPAENILMIDSRTREIASTVLSTWLVSLHSGVSQWIAKKNSHLNFCQLAELPLVLIIKSLSQGSKCVYKTRTCALMGTLTLQIPLISEMIWTCIVLLRLFSYGKHLIVALSFSILVYKWVLLNCWVHLVFVQSIVI